MFKCAQRREHISRAKGCIERNPSAVSGYHVQAATCSRFITNPLTISIWTTPLTSSTGILWPFGYQDMSTLGQYEEIYMRNIYEEYVWGKPPLLPSLSGILWPSGYQDMSILGQYEEIRIQWYEVMRIPACCEDMRTNKYEDKLKIWRWNESSLMIRTWGHANICWIWAN